MNTLVFGEGGKVRKMFATNITLEWFFLGMNPQVTNLSGFLRKSLTTNVTHVPTHGFVQVTSDMNSQTVFGQKFFGTCEATE